MMRRADFRISSYSGKLGPPSAVRAPRATRAALPESSDSGCVRADLRREAVRATERNTCGNELISNTPPIARVHGATPFSSSALRGIGT